MSALHVGCVNHVSVAKALAYCPTTGLLYFSGSHFRYDGPKPIKWTPWDFEIMNNTVCSAIARYPWVRFGGAVMLLPEDTMPGLLLDGSPPATTAPFLEKKR